MKQMVSSARKRLGHRLLVAKNNALQAQCNGFGASATFLGLFTA
jgi:hypothetical protein